MDNIKHKPLYNHMFFKETESIPYNKNEKFWEQLTFLCMKHPEMIITVEYFVVKDPYVSYLAEDVRVSCNLQSLQSICDQIYHSYYYRVPLTLHKEFEGKDEIVKLILEDQAKNDK